MTDTPSPTVSATPTPTAATTITLTPSITATPTITITPGGVQLFSSLAAFNAAAGNPPVVLDFEEDPPGTTNITSPYGYTLRGLKFDLNTTTPASAPLIIVRGADTFTPPGFTGVTDASTNKLFPTSGVNVLSPGGESLVPGPDPNQEDGMTLTFPSPVSAFGFDLLLQSSECCSSSRHLFVFGTGGEILFTADVATSGPNGTAGGAVFVGIVSNSANIARIMINETDRDNVTPDSNIGYDTFRFAVAPVPVNDDFANAIQLTSFPTPLILGSSASATTETGEPTTACGPTSRTVWYRVIPTQDGVLTAATQGDKRTEPLQDSVVSIYQGTALNSLVEVACDDDSGPGRTDLVSANVTAFNTYYVRVSSYFPTSGPWRLQVTLTP